MCGIRVWGYRPVAIPPHCKTNGDSREVFVENSGSEDFSI